jgi:endoglucanase
MKRYFLPALLLFFAFSQNLLSQNVFNKGVNLTGWFQTDGIKQVSFTKYTKQDFENIKSLGCDVIRLPVNLHFMTSGAPDYKVDTLFYYLFDQVVDWAEEVNIKLILDNHTISGANSITVENPVIRIWPQIAKHYKDRSDLLYYEVLNEPNTITTSQWNVIQKKAIDSIRAYDTRHTIIVGGSGYNGIGELSKLPVYADTNLIYTFHFYDPFLFTHQGASWASPSMIDLAGVPFPYDATRMPACPASLKGTWIEGSLANSYKNDGTVAKLQSAINGAISFATTRKVRIYCGELGVYNRNSPEADRITWYHEVCSYLTEKSVPWTIWDYQGGFGLFKKGSDGLFEYDMIAPLADTIGFTPPVQKEYTVLPDSAEFEIYTDFAGAGISQGGGSSTGIVDYYSSNAFGGWFCLHMSGVPQYTNADLDFRLDKDLSKLRSENYAVDFWVKGDVSGSDFVLRFLDTKTSDPSDHPWRMDYTVNSSNAEWDNTWHHVNIPLKSFSDAGSWDGSWFNSTNSFNWKAVDRFQIVAEHAALTGKNFWFDNILVTNRKNVSARDNSGALSYLQVFPNPCTDILNIVSKETVLSLSVFDISGREWIRTTPGATEFSLPVENLIRGCYFLQLKTNSGNSYSKLIHN